MQDIISKSRKGLINPLDLKKVRKILQKRVSRIASIAVLRVLMSLVLSLPAVFAERTPSLKNPPSGLSLAYQVIIPVGAGDLTELNSYGGENWFAINSPQGKKVPVGEVTRDDKGIIISIDKTKSPIRIASAGRLVIDPADNRLGWPIKGEIVVNQGDYQLLGGEKIKIPKKTEGGTEKDEEALSELRAHYQDYVFGKGRDLYQLENTPQGAATEPLSHIHGIIRVRVSADVEGRARTLIKTHGKIFKGDWQNQTGLIHAEYKLNPATNKEWTWQEVDELQAGIELDNGKAHYVYAEIETLVGSQTFFPVTPVECTPTVASSWRDVDLDTYISGLGSDVTGVLLHIVNRSATSYYIVEVRKNGSTDSGLSSYYLGSSTHTWMAIGVDSNHIFEAYTGSTTDVDFYIVGYTKTGVTFFTNAYNKSLSTTGSWQDINCATEAPNAIGLIFQVGNQTANFGLRKKGSTDNRVVYSWYSNTFGFIVGCDTSQVCQGNISATTADFYLNGYITDGAVFNTNATDLSLGTTASWSDLAALPSEALMGFIEVVTPGTAYKYGLRKNGTAEDIYYKADRHPFAIVESDGDRIIEGEIENTAVDFFLVGYASVPPVVPTVTTSACTGVGGSSATGNGNITATGGENATTRGFCYMLGTSGDPTTANSTAYDTGSFGAGAYTKGITGLSPLTNYRVRAYAINSAGTGYGTTVQLTTPEEQTIIGDAIISDILIQ